MRKKCVQSWDSLWKNLWDTQLYTHYSMVHGIYVNNFTVLHSLYTATIHSITNVTHLCYNKSLSTPPTGPTITTLFLKNTLVNHRGGVV